MRPRASLSPSRSPACVTRVTRVTRVACVARVAMAAGAISLLGGCAPPTDRWTRVSTDDAPLLPEGEDDAPVAAVLHAGDLVRVGATVKPRFSWKGMLAGRPASAEGELVEVRRAGEGGGFMFRGQLGEEVSAVTSEYLCHRIQGGAGCADKLRRIVLGDATIGYLPCFAEACPVALVRGRRLSFMSIDGLTDLRPATIDHQEVLLATAALNHEPRWSERFMYVLRTRSQAGQGGDSLSRVHEIKLAELDVRTPRNHSYEGTVTIEPDQIVFKGRERWTSAIHDGAVLSDVPKSQIYRLSPRK